MTLLERVYLALSRRGLCHLVPDKIHLSIKYHALLGQKLNWNNPIGFNEKLQWLKVHDRNPLYNVLVDKYAVKEWVAERIGSEYVTKTYARWDQVDDINFDQLPEKFVLKTNHDCGGIVICRDRTTFDMDAAKAKLGHHLKRNYFWEGREWPYKAVKPCIFAEEYLDSGASGLTDYKFMCFDGKARCVFTCTGRSDNDLRVDFFDLEWKHLPFTRHYPNAEVPPSVPEKFKEMVLLSERLAQAIPFVRVDFYEIAGSLYFGELTFYPGSGFEEFDPRVWDTTLGSWIELPRGLASRE